jgi:hypothetical protein
VTADEPDVATRSEPNASSERGLVSPRTSIGRCVLQFDQRDT